MALRLQNAVRGSGIPLTLSRLCNSNGQNAKCVRPSLYPSHRGFSAGLRVQPLLVRGTIDHRCTSLRAFHSSSAAQLQASHQRQQQKQRQDGKEEAGPVESQQPSSGEENSPSSSSSLLRDKAKAVSEDILTIPNVLTTMRLLSTPLLGYLIVIDEMRYALILLAASGFTDLLDGWLARRFNSSTVFGSIADPAADKALMTVMVGALAWRGLIPVPLVVLIVGRDLALVASAFVIRYRTLAPPKTMERYWDPRLPSAQVQPTQVSKYNTFLQLILVAGCTVIAALDDEWRAWWEDARGLWGQEQQQSEENKLPSSAPDELRGKDIAKKAWHAFMGVVAATTIWSGASYLSGSGAVQLSKLVKNKSKSASM